MIERETKIWTEFIKRYKHRQREREREKEGERERNRYSKRHAMIQRE